MAAKPAFSAFPKPGIVQIATANANRDGTGTLGTILTMGGSGGRLDRISAMAVGTTTAGIIRYYVSFDAGTTKRLIAEREVKAVTPSASVAGFRDVWTPDLLLPASAVVYASTEKAETFNVIGEAGDL